MSNVKNILNSKSSILSVILILYIYTPFFINIMENSLKMSSIYGYIIYFNILLIILITIKKVKKNVLLFFALFFLIIIINCIFVSYKKYVLVEGLQAFICMIIPCLCISSKYFDIDDFIKKWSKYALFNLFMILISIILLKLKMVNYSLFTSICIPNVFIMSYMIFQGNKKTRLWFINIIINIITLGIFGGRMAAVAALFMFVVSYLLSKNIKIWKKILLVMFLMVSIYFIVINLNDILIWLREKMIHYNIDSRSINLLIMQIKNKEIYITNRDYIYNACIEYIIDRHGLPGGFGIPLYITAGRYYYTHNIFLQFLTFFGIWGTIFVFEIIILRYKTIINKLSNDCKRFLFFLIISYSIIGLTGSSIWIHYLSTIFISLYFFGSEKIYNYKYVE